MQIVREFSDGQPDFEAASSWGTSAFEKALLCLGDMTGPLTGLTRKWLARNGDGITGLAVRFSGFNRDVVSIAADDGDAVDALLSSAMGSCPVTLVLSRQTPVPQGWKLVATDNWMVGPCDLVDTPSEVGAIGDLDALKSFYAGEGMTFWAPAMFEFGHCYGIRDRSGALVSACSLNFILPSHHYAQIGPLATRADCRRRSYGSAVFGAVRCSLARSGITRAGLFADAQDVSLREFYQRRGLRVLQQFRFLELAGG